MGIIELCFAVSNMFLCVCLCARMFVYWCKCWLSLSTQTSWVFIHPHVQIRVLFKNKLLMARKCFFSFSCAGSHSVCGLLCCVGKKSTNMSSVFPIFVNLLLRKKLTYDLGDFQLNNYNNDDDNNNNTVQHAHSQHAYYELRL